MPNLLRRLPFFQDQTTLRIPNGPAIEIKHHQIILWVSLSPASQIDPPGSDTRIPALLDLGFNGEFLLREDHVHLWAKLAWEESAFPLVGAITAHGERVPIFEGNIWIHPNVPGFRDQINPSKPYRLEFDAGIAVCPASMARCRLPLLGLSALRKNHLRLFVNGEKKYISLRAPVQR